MEQKLLSQFLCSESNKGSRIEPDRLPFFKYYWRTLSMMLLMSISSVTTMFGQAFSGTYPFTSVTTTSGLTDPTAVPTATGVTFGSFSSVISGQTNPSAASRFSFTNPPLGATNGSNTFTGSLDAAKYYQVTVTAAAGYTMTLSSITFTIQRSGTGIRQYAVRSDADSYAANLAASISPTNAALSVVSTDIFQITDATTTASVGSTITLSGASFTTLAAGTSRTFRFYGWNAEAAGGNLSIDDVVISGTATSTSSATITPTSAALTGLTYVAGSGPSTATSNTISASTLTAGGGTITFTGSTNFEVSTTSISTGFGSTATLTYTGTGTLAANTVWTRLKAGISASTISAETISISGGGATSSFTAAGSVTAAPTATITPTTAALTGLTYVAGSGPSTATANTITASTLTAGGGTITFTGSTNFEVSTTSISTGFGSTATLTYTGTGTLAANTVWTRLKAGLSAATYSAETINISGGGASSSFTAAGSVTASSIITPTTAALTGLTYVAGSGPSTATANTITASNLTSGGGTITFTGSTNFEVSTTSISTGFGSTATLTYTGTGTLAANTVWTRLKAGISASTISAETINISGGGASSSFTAAGSVTPGVTPFTGGNIVVEKVGNGSALSSAAFPVAVDEYNTSFSFQQSVAFNNSPTVTSPANLTSAGSSGQDGLMTLSSDGKFLTVPGYNLTTGTASAGSAAGSNRVIGLANANGTTSIPVSNAAILTGNNFRSVTSDGTNYWGAGGSGQVYINNGGTVNSTAFASTNTRAIGIYNGQLFYSTGSGTTGVYSIGTGIPNTNAAVAGTLVVSNGASTTNSPNQFSFNPTHDICYLADNGTFANGGGIRKYTRSGATWTLAYTLNRGTAATTAVIGLIVDWSGSSPVIYATEGTASANRILKVVDDGTALSSTNTSGTAPTFSVAAATNYRLAGIAFAPNTPSIVLSSLTTGTAQATTVAPFATFADGYTTTLGPIATATSSFTVKAYNLSSNTVTVSAPTNFQVSTSASSGFASSIVLTPTSGSIANQVVYVRLASGLSTGTFTGNVTVKTTTASLCPQWGNIFVTGAVAALTPAITAPASLPTSLTGFTTVTPAASSAQSFTFTAINLTSALTITASSPYEISTPSVNSGAYASSLNLGSAATFTGVISVRFPASATAGTYASGTITTSTSDVDITGVTIASLSGTVFSGVFSTGNLAVEVIGDGVNAKSNAACQVNVWEFNNAGVIKNQFPFTPNATLPTSSPYNVTASANATSEGNVGLSADGTKLLVAGYNATIGTATIATSLSANNNRVLATLKQNGTKTTTAYDIFNANNARSIASNGYSYWYAGTPTGGAGLYYMFDENSGATAVSLGSVNLRVAKIFNNTFYYSTATTGNIGIFQLGTNGLPITVSNTNVTRLTNSTYASGGSPYGFAINSASDIMYIADDRAFTSSSSQSSGGIIKYAKVSGVWTYQYTMRPLASNTLGARGIEVDWSGANPVIYSTTGASSNTSNDLVVITDNGTGSDVGTSISTASSLYVYRGVQFAPKALSTPKLYCTANLLDFGGQPVNGVSAEKSFNVSGALFTGNITVSIPVTSPTGQYGLSLTSGGPYTNSVTISGGAPANATIYMVFRPTAVNTYNGNLTIAATGATSVTVPVQGQCINPTNYYNKPSTDITNPLNWGTNTDGTGSSPTNFTDNGQYFNIVNATNTLSSAQTSATIIPDGIITTSGDNFITFASLPSCPSSPSSYYVGATITGAGIPANTTITSIVGNTLYLSNATTAASSAVTLSVPVSSPFVISGTISKLVIGDGAASTIFTIPSNYAYSGVIDVKDNSTLILKNALVPTFGTLDINSTVDYAQTGSYTLPYNQSGTSTISTITFGNLKLTGTVQDTRSLPTSSNIAFPFVVAGNFIADNVKVLGQSVSPYTFMKLGGDLIMQNNAVMVSATPNTNATMINVVTTGNNVQNFTYTGGTIRLNTLTSTKSSGGINISDNTTLLLNGNQTPTATYDGATLNFSGNAAFTSGVNSSFNATGIGNINLNFSGTSTFNLGGPLNTSDNSSSSFGITASSSLKTNFSATTNFNDNGNSIVVSGDLSMAGSAAAYQLTGDVTIRTRTGVSNIDNGSGSSIVPHLNNFILDAKGGTNLIVQPATGGVMNVDGNFTINSSVPSSYKIDGQGNSIKIAGNYLNSNTNDMITSSTTTWEFNGTSAQTFSTAFNNGESFNKFKMNNNNGLTLLSGDIKTGANGSIVCTSGIVTTGTNKLILSSTGTITETTTNYVLGNVQSTRTLTNAAEAFGGLGLTITSNGNAPGSTAVLRNTGTVQTIGCVNSSILRSFKVTPTVNSGLNATINFKYIPTLDQNGLVNSNLVLFNGSLALSSTLNGSNIFTATSLDSLGLITASVDKPNLTITNPTAVCEPGTVSLTANAITAGSATGTLAYWTDNLASTSLSTPSAVATSGTYYISLTNLSGCQTIQPVVVTINPTPTITLGSYTTPVCSPLAGQPDNVVFSGTVAVSSDVTITRSNLPLGVSSSVSSSVTTFNGVTSFNISESLVNTSIFNRTITYTINTIANNGSCTSSQVVTIVVIPQVNLLVTDPAAVCTPNMVNLTQNAITTGSSAGTKTYWTDAAASNSIPDATQVSTGTYYIQLTNAGGCFDIKPVNSTINTTPTITVGSFNSPVCSSLSTDLVSNVTFGGTISVSSTGLISRTLPAGVIASNSAAFTVNGTSFNFDEQLINNTAVAKVVNYSVSVSETNGGCSSTEIVSITVQPSTTTPVSVNATQCAAGQPRGSVVNVTNTDYAWYQGTTLLSGESANALSSAQSISTTTSYDVAAQNVTTGCWSEKSAVTSYMLLSTPSIVSNGNNPVCSTDEFRLQLQSPIVTNDVTYKWYSQVNYPNTGWGSPLTIPNLSTPDTFHISNQYSATWYKLEVGCVSDGLTATSTILTITQKSLQLCTYCTIVGSCAPTSPTITGVKLKAVALNTDLVSNLNNGCNSNSQQFTLNNDGITSLTTLYKSSTTNTISYSIELTPKLSSGTYVTVWYDFNLDGLFQNNEKIVTDQTLTTTASFNFSVPSNALTGNGVMRVISYGVSNPTLTLATTNASNCPSSIVGEIEDYFINISPIPNPVNDNINSPLPLPTLTVNYVSTAINATNATATTSANIAGSGWANNTSYKDVWYQCTVPSTGVVYINLLPGTLTNADMQVWESSNNTFSGTLTSLGADDNSGVGNMPFMKVATTPGKVLFIQVRSNTSTIGGTFTIAATYGVNWKGSINTDWNTSGNWYNDMVPTSTYDVVIPVTTNIPTVSSASSIKSVFAANGANVVLNQNLTFTGNLSMYGTATASSQIRFRGAGELISTGTANSILSNVIVGNFTEQSGTLTIDAANGKLNVADVLKPSGGSIVTNNNLYIRSYNSGTINTATYLGTGQIAQGVGTFAGDVIIERKIPATNYTSQHYVSSPITSTTNTVTDNYGDDYSVVGSPYPFQYTGVAPAPQPTVWPTSWWYDASLTSSSTAYRWMNASGKAMSPGMGVSLNIAGNKLIDVQGAPQQSDFALNVSSGQGNLIGNPYPSTIDLDKFIGDNSSNIGGSTVYYNKLGNNVSYSTLAGGTSVPDVYGDHRERFMAHSNAFWINATGGVILFNNSQREYKPQIQIAGALGGTFYTANQGANANNLRIRVKDASNSTFDEMLIAKDANTQDGIDNYDASKFMMVETNPQPYIYSVLDGQNLVINAMPNVEGKEIPVGVVTTSAGKWTISVHNSDAFVSEASTLVLEDRSTGIFYNLKNTPEVTFDMPEGNVGSRFYIHVGNATTSVKGISAASKGVSIYSNSDKLFVNFGTELKGSTTVEVYNLTGQLMTSVDATSFKGIREVSMNNAAAGNYLVKVVNGGNVVTDKVFIDKK